METNWYNLSRQWFDYCFENPEKINTNHTALYMFIIDRWNRFWQKEKFWLPADFTMEALQIKSRNTYYKIFNDLIEMWFIEIIEKSKNQNTANIIKLACVKNNQADKPALDIANMQATNPAPVPAEEHNKTNKQINNLTNKQILSKDKEQSSEIIKVDKRDLEIDIIIETMKSFNLWIVDDTIQKQRRYWKLIKDKMLKIKWFDWRYQDFITMLYENSDEYRKNHFRSLEKFYREMANIITWIKIQSEKKPVRRGC